MSTETIAPASLPTAASVALEKATQLERSTVPALQGAVWRLQRRVAMLEVVLVVLVLGIMVWGLR